MPTHLPEKVQGSNLRDIKRGGGGGGAHPQRDLRPCQQVYSKCNSMEAMFKYEFGSGSPGSHVRIIKLF